MAICDNRQMAIPITDLEQAINFWRTRAPSQGEERRLCAPAGALAEVYALLIFHRRSDFDVTELGAAATAAFAAWQAEAPRAG